MTQTCISRQNKRSQKTAVFRGFHLSCSFLHVQLIGQEIKREGRMGEEGEKEGRREGSVFKTN